MQSFAPTCRALAIASWATTVVASSAAQGGAEWTAGPSGLRVRCVQVEGQQGVAAVLGFAGGRQLDPPGRSGMVEAAGELLRLTLDRRGAPARTAVEVTPQAVVLQTSAPQLADIIALWLPLLDAEMQFDDDACARAVWRTALRADDHREVFPGPILTGLTARALFQGRDADGSAATLGDLEPATLRAFCRAAFHPVRARLLLATSDPPAVAAARARALLAPLASRSAEDLPASNLQPDQTLELQRPHRRVAAAYVSCGWRCPDASDADFAASLVAMELVRDAAVAAFGRPRGGEAAARLTPFSHDPLRAPVAVVGRRAPTPFPGTSPAPTAVVERTSAEIEGVLAAAERAANPPVVASTVARLQRLYDDRGPGVPPGMSAHTALPWLRRAALRAIGEWPVDLVDRLASVTPGAVADVLAAMTAPDRRVWCALLPMAR